MMTPSIPSPYEQALQLALRIEGLVARARGEANCDREGARLAEALTGNLIDQLESLRAARAV